MEDYLKAYTATGGPPLPVVQEPAGTQARAALGLPPLFEPYTEPVTGESSTSSVVASTAPTTDPAKLPRIHAFQPVQSEGDTYQSIAAVPEYSFFSHEVSVVGCDLPRLLTLLASRNCGAMRMLRASSCRPLHSPWTSLP